MPTEGEPWEGKIFFPDPVAIPGVVHESYYMSGMIDHQVQSDQHFSLSLYIPWDKFGTSILHVVRVAAPGAGMHIPISGSRLSKGLRENTLDKRYISDAVDGPFLTLSRIELVSMHFHLRDRTHS